MERIKNGFKQLRLKDFLAPLIFLLLFLPARIFKVKNHLKGHKLWLVCEQEDTARDNGYYFYKYIREKHPDDFCFYAIDKKSKAYNRVKPLGNIIQFGSLKHWLYYLAADLNISSQKNGNPSTLFFYIIHVSLGLYRNRVFLQHGVIINDTKWLYYDQTKFKKFICGAKLEYNYIRKNFGYPSDAVIYTGLARHDNLHDVKIDSKSILVMPTWRNWLGREVNSLNKVTQFEDSSYYQNWNRLINDQELITYLEKNNITLYFYPHINMQKFITKFHARSKNIRILTKDADIQSYIKKSALLITDYSSVFTDFAYMKKPIIFYQFDKADYRKYQYKQGYYNYETGAFGKTYSNSKEVVDAIVKTVKNGYKVDDRYIDYRNKFFEKFDTKNCERIYDSLNPNSKRKIMHVTYVMNTGGIESFLMNLFRHYNDENTEFVVVAHDKNSEFYYESELSDLNVRLIKIHAPGIGYRVRHVLELYKIFRREKPDVVHGHTYFDNANVMIAAKLAGVKVRVTHSHTNQPWAKSRRFIYPVFRKILCTLSTHRLACSQIAGEALYGTTDFKVLPNGIFIDEYCYSNEKRELVRKQLNIPASAKVIGHVGRMVEVKNHKFLLDVLHELLKTDQNYYLLLIGTGNLEPQIKAYAKKLKLLPNIIFLGDSDKVPELLNAMDIFTLPSLYEGLCTALIEAQINGLPTIVSDVVPKEAKISESTTFLSLSRGPKFWAEKIINTRLYRTNISDITTTNFSIDDTAGFLKNIYNNREA